MADAEKFYVRFVDTFAPLGSSGCLEGLFGQDEPTRHCTVRLPEARGPGNWMIRCVECGASLVCSASGKAGDIAEIELPCSL